MKSLKISFIAILAIVVGIAGSAFTTQNAPNKKTDQVWFKLTDGQSPLVASNYYIDSEDPTPSCAYLPEIVCAIRVTDNGGEPDATEFAALKNTTHDFADVNADVKYMQAPQK